MYKTIQNLETNDGIYMGIPVSGLSTVLIKSIETCILNNKFSYNFIFKDRLWKEKYSKLRFRP